MHADPGMDPTVRSRLTENLQHLSDLQMKHTSSPFLREITGADERRMRGETEEQWHKRITGRHRLLAILAP